MTRKETLEKVINQLVTTLPSSLQSVRDNIEQHLKANIQTLLADLAFVTREEFEVQAAVLQRTRQKLEALEAILAKLESKS